MAILGTDVFRVSCPYFFSEFDLQYKDTVQSGLLWALSSSSFNWSLTPGDCLHLEHWTSSDSMLPWVWKEKEKNTTLSLFTPVFFVCLFVCFILFCFLIFLNTLIPWCFARQGPWQHNRGEIKSGSWGKSLWGRTTTALAKISLHCQEAASFTSCSLGYAQSNTVVQIRISFAFSPFTMLWFPLQRSLHAQAVFSLDEIKWQ